MSYRERLWAPVGWWLFALFFVASIGLAYQHALGPWVSLPVTAVLMGVAAAGIIGYGRVRIRVDDGGLTAGRAHLPPWAIGRIEALDATATRTARGIDLDARAFTLIRGYVPAAVRVSVHDDADPVPYWLVSTRHPERLSAALSAIRSQDSSTPAMAEPPIAKPPHA